MCDQPPNEPEVPNVPNEESETSQPHSTVTGEIVDGPTSSDLEIQQGPGTLITPGEAMPIYNIRRLKEAMSSNDLTPEFLIERLALFANHPNPSYALGAMRLLCSHIESVLKIHGITVKAEAPAPPKKEKHDGEEDRPEESSDDQEGDREDQDPDPDPDPEPEEPLGHRISGTRLALDRRAVDGPHPWATLRRSTRGSGNLDGAND